MNYLEASRVVSGFAGGAALPFVFAMSGTPDKLGLFLRAAAARRGRSAQPRVLPFNTLPQWLHAEPVAGEAEVLLLLPWDFVPEVDWRSGIAETTPDHDQLWTRAEATAAMIASRPRARVVYLPAPILPIFSDPTANAGLQAGLLTLACRLGAHILSADAFSLGSYFSSGCPFAGNRLFEIADEIIARAETQSAHPRKVLVTDLDNVLWYGVIGEDGLDGIRCSPDGVGYRFFAYQTVLAKLEREGTLLAAVSRNDQHLALAPFRAGRMYVKQAQFVCIIASYNAKSSQIAEIARRLNLGLDSFVFIDDNPLELAEVSAQLPEIQCIQFPAADAGLPDFLARLTGLFARSTVTAEDRIRTGMYRSRLAGLAPTNVAGADLTEFLRGLDMHLTFTDRSQGDRTRAVQLINKTNQFNLNGRRLADHDVAGVLTAGGRLFTATLTDRNGTHGEILACLINSTGGIESFVMSCRVFQRRVEFAFLAWLGAHHAPLRYLCYRPTERNEPIRQFLEDPAFAHATNGVVAFDPAAFAQRHTRDLGLFRLEVPGVLG
jgi:FkbH-like protein